MVQKPTPKKTATDPNELSAMEFRWFLQHFPDYILKLHGIPGGAFWGVGMALAQHIDYESGTGSRLSQRGIAAIARTTPRTTKRVIEFMKSLGVIVVRDLQRRNGKDSENYNFRKSSIVRDVLDKANQHWKPESTSTGAPELQQVDKGLMLSDTSTGAPELQTVVPELQTVVPEPMIRTQDPKIEKNSSEESSLAPVVAQPAARDGAAEKHEEEISSIGSFDVDEFLSGLGEL